VQMKIKNAIGLFLFFFLVGCDEDIFIPKPTGYARIDFPEHQYVKLEVDCPFEFEHGVMANYQSVNSTKNSNCWFNLDYPGQNAKVHFSYLPIEDTEFNKFIEDARKLALEHLSKADDFEESVVRDTAARVYGVIYDFKGSTASNLQFYLTDSIHHFVRGALYFNVVPKADSIAPSEQYIEQEIQHLIETFTWK
jgi:gliding motility-associated lipoprotein GldD